MATNDTPSEMFPGLGGGGSGWEQPIRDAGPSMQYDTRLGRFVVGWLNVDGSVTPASQTPGPWQSGYVNGDLYNIPASLDPRQQPSMPTGGGGAPGGSLFPRLSKVGSLLSSAGSGMADGRRQDAAANAQAAATNNRAMVDAATFNANVPLARAQQTARGDLMSADIPQSQVSGSGRTVSFTGGVGPQSFSQTTTDAGNALKKQALEALMTGSDRVTPQMVTPSRAGATENVLSGLGLAANLYGAYRGK